MLILRVIYSIPTSDPTFGSTSYVLRPLGRRFFCLDILGTERLARTMVHWLLVPKMKKFKRNRYAISSNGGPVSTFMKIAGNLFSLPNVSHCDALLHLEPLGQQWRPSGQHVACGNGQQAQVGGVPCLQQVSPSAHFFAGSGHRMSLLVDYKRKTCS